MTTCAMDGCDKEAVIRFCCYEHKVKFFNDRRDRRNHKTKDCPACGTRFTAQPNRITCSTRCRQRLYQCRKVVRAAEANKVA